MGAAHVLHGSDVYARQRWHGGRLPGLLFTGTASVHGQRLPELQWRHVECRSGMRQSGLRRWSVPGNVRSGTDTVRSHSDGQRRADLRCNRRLGPDVVLHQYDPQYYLHLDNPRLRVVHGCMLPRSDVPVQYQLLQRRHCNLHQRNDARLPRATHVLWGHAKLRQRRLCGMHRDLDRVLREHAMVVQRGPGDPRHRMRGSNSRLRRWRMRGVRERDDGHVRLHRHGGGLQWHGQLATREPTLHGRDVGSLHGAGGDDDVRQHVRADSGPLGDLPRRIRVPWRLPRRADADAVSGGRRLHRLSVRRPPLHVCRDADPL